VRLATAVRSFKLQASNFNVCKSPVTPKKMTNNNKYNKRTEIIADPKTMLEIRVSNPSRRTTNQSTQSAPLQTRIFLRRRSGGTFTDRAVKDRRLVGCGLIGTGRVTRSSICSRVCSLLKFGRCDLRRGFNTPEYYVAVV
jgi:hypothetical protein